MNNNMTVVITAVITTIVTFAVMAAVVGGKMYHKKYDYKHHKGSWHGEHAEECTGHHEYKKHKEEKMMEMKEDEAKEAAFKEMLYKKEGYPLPFGSAEIEGYITTVQRHTSFDESTPDVDCTGFVVMNGPKELLDALDELPHIESSTVVIGPKNDYYDQEYASSKEEPIKMFVNVHAGFEGGIAGCMAWPLEPLVVVE